MTILDTTAIDQSLAELESLAAKVKKPQALFYILIDLCDLEFVSQGECAPLTSYYGQPVTPARDIDEMAVGDFYNEKRQE